MNATYKVPYDYKLDILFVSHYLFAGTHLPFYVVKYAKLYGAEDLERRIALAARWALSNAKG